jgi:hypothetical protein
MQWPAESYVASIGSRLSGLPANIPNAINATLYEKLNFNFIRDIAPVASVSRDFLILVAHPSVPANTIPNSSPTPRRIQARSTWHQAASGRRPILPENSST